MQRLFSTFPGGLPGAGIFVLRIAVAIPLAHAGLQTALSPNPVIAEMMAAAAAILLLVGFWTPIAAGLIAVAELALAWSCPANRWTFLHLSLLSASLAMLGPGGCSVDARLFGRKRIEVPQR